MLKSSNQIALQKAGLSSVFVFISRNNIGNDQADSHLLEGTRVGRPFVVLVQELYFLEKFSRGQSET